MAKVYLDANVLIDIAEKRKQISLNDFLDHKIYSSLLSFHILAYSVKYKVPSQKLSELVRPFTIIPFHEEILLKSLSGPLGDLEDNIQLHSAAEAECDYFLTSDEKLLKMKFFGKTKIYRDFNHTN